MRISDWSSDVCSSDLSYRIDPHGPGRRFPQCQGVERPCGDGEYGHAQAHDWQRQAHIVPTSVRQRTHQPGNDLGRGEGCWRKADHESGERARQAGKDHARQRSEEHTSELQSLMRISYAVFCLKKKKKNTHTSNMKETNITSKQHTTA